MSGPASRRGFLRGLSTLPLIGGSVALIGQPTRAATPITPGLLAHYTAWLMLERRLLTHVSCGGGGDWASAPPNFDPWMFPVWSRVHPTTFDFEHDGRRAQERAAVVLAAVGCPLTSPEAEAKWQHHFRPITGGAA